MEVEAPEVDQKVRISFKIGSESGRVISKLINRQKDHLASKHTLMHVGSLNIICFHAKNTAFSKFLSKQPRKGVNLIFVLPHTFLTSRYGHSRIGVGSTSVCMYTYLISASLGTPRIFRYSTLSSDVIQERSLSSFKNA